MSDDSTEYMAKAEEALRAATVDLQEWRAIDYLTEALAWSNLAVAQAIREHNETYVAIHRG